MRKLPKPLVNILLLLIAIVVLASLREVLLEKDKEAAQSSKIQYAEMVKDNHKLLKEFRTRHPERTVLLACAEDITNDGIEDLVLISQEGKDISSIALFSQEDGSLGETEPIPAPRENQHIRFFNMDKLSEIETLITGEKNGQVGYAIYRIMDGAMVNLFGEGMEDCC